MFSTSEVAFTIAIATVVLLFYYLYSILFKTTECSQDEEESLKSKHSTIWFFFHPFFNLDSEIRRSEGRKN